MLLLLGACGGQDAISPPPGTEAGRLHIVIVTSGADADPDGYMLLVNNVARTALASEADTTIGDLTPGHDSIALTGIASNCTAGGPNPSTVDVAAGVTAELSVAITCTALPTALQIVNVVTGRDVATEGFAVAIDGGAAHPLVANGTTLISVSAGQHSLAFASAAANCAFAAPPGTVTLTAGDTHLLSVSSICKGPLRGMIVFVRQAGGADQLFTIKADGSGEEQLTHGTIPYAIPAVSPDGMRIAALRGTATSQPDAMVIMDNDGTNEQVLRPEGVLVLDLKWLPDGRLAYTEFVGFGSNQICTVTAAGGSPACTTAPVTGTVGVFTFSPDASKVVFGGLYGMDGNGSNGHALAVSGFQPDWSPDGSKLVFQHAVDVNGDGTTEPEIYVSDPDGSNAVQLTSAAVVQESPRWSPDGSRIAYVSWSASGCSEVKVMNADGSGQHKLSQNGSCEQRPVWSPIP